MGMHTKYKYLYVWCCMNIFSALGPLSTHNFRYKHINFNFSELKHANLNALCVYFNAKTGRIIVLWLLCAHCNHAVYFCLTQVCSL